MSRLIIMINTLSLNVEEKWLNLGEIERVFCFFFLNLRRNLEELEQVFV